jgi:membrane-associated phospholipid phosphatase
MSLLLRRARDPRVLAAGCAVACAGFALTAWAAFHVPRLDHLDARVFVDLSAHRKGALGHLATPIGYLGAPLPQALFLLAGIAVALASGRREAAIAGLVIVLGADLSTHLLKDALAAPRGDATLELGDIDDNAFPSGHTTAAFSMAAAWCLFVPARRRRLVAAIGFVAAGLVAISAVILHHHFPSDVIGGFFVAAAWTCGVCAVLRNVHFAQENPRGRASLRA